MIKRKRHGNRNPDFKLATWNVLSLHRKESLQKLLKELEEYRIDVAAVQEIRWTGKGNSKRGRHTVYYSCDDRLHTFGTGFIVNQNMASSVIGFKPINPRLCYLRVKAMFHNISMISIHAPTEVSSADEKDSFFEELQTCLDVCPRGDIKIVIGDCNAQVGRETYFRPTIGKHSIHEQSNDNGLKLIYFAGSNNMVIGSTLFSHKRIHLATWKSNDGATTNQIDHVLISAKHLSSLIDVRTFRGANVDSDHHLVVARIRQRISVARQRLKKDLRNTSVKKYNLDKLRSEGIQLQYAKTMEEKLRSMEWDDVEKAWNGCRVAIEETAEEILGIEERKRSAWFDTECKEATDNKNEAYIQMIQKHHTRASVELYRTKRRTEKKIHRRKKRAWEKKELEEELRNNNESRHFYQKQNYSRKDFGPETIVCKNKDGALICEKGGILECWRDHYSSQLDADKEQVIETGEIRDKAQEDVDDIEPPDEDEIIESIKSLKNNIAPGYDGIPSELFKYGGPDLVKVLQEIIQQVWKNEIIPTTWNKSIIVPIHIKGDILNFRNYRGISLLPSIYKILSGILSNRLLPFTERAMGHYQAGFQKNNSTRDQIFSLRHILEKSREYNIKLHMLLIDYIAAYNSIDRGVLYQTLLELEIPPKLVRLIKMTMNEAQCAVKVKHEISEFFTTYKGVSEGDVLGCQLFSLALEKVIRKSGIQTSHNVFKKSEQLLAYADDVVLIGLSSQVITEAFLKLDDAGKEIGLKVNQEKTKYLCTDCGNRKQEINVGRYKFEWVEGFVFLGTLINSENNIQDEIKRRILLANRCYYELHKHLKSQNLSRSTKTLIYKKLVRPVLTYGSENWVLKKTDELTLQCFEKKVLRKIYGAVLDGETWRRRTNIELKAIYKDADIVSVIKLGRLRWAGQIARMDGDEGPRNLLDERIQAKRRRGRPKQRWMDSVKEDALVLLQQRNWKETAQDKERWRSLLSKATSASQL